MTKGNAMTSTHVSAGVSRRGLLANALALPVVIGLPVSLHAQTDPLPSWNEGASKQAIVEFVDRVTRQGGPDFVPPAERIATFDNDGTLWCEHPMYVQLVFAPDRVKTMPPRRTGGPWWT
jgi:hypothetical protein